MSKIENWSALVLRERLEPGGRSLALQSPTGLLLCWMVKRCIGFLSRSVPVLADHGNTVPHGISGHSMVTASFYFLTEVCQKVMGRFLTEVCQKRGGFFLMAAPRERFMAKPAPNRTDVRVRIAGDDAINLKAYADRLGLPLATAMRMLALESLAKKMEEDRREAAESKAHSDMFRRQLLDG